VRTDPSANIRQTPAWGDCIRRTDGLVDATRCYESSDGRTVVLPLVRRRGMPTRLRSESSWPGPWGFCGPLATDGRLTADEVVGVIADLRGRQVLRTSVPVPRAAEAPFWAEHMPAGAVRHTHVLDLSGGFDTVWGSRFAGTVRTASRKAERLGVTVESDTTGRLLPVFDTLYRRSVDRWAAARQDSRVLARLLAARREPSRKFQVVADQLGEACEMHVAWRDGQPLAGIIVLSHGSVANYWRGAMDHERIAGTGANELLHRVAIERACRRGCERYDMQRSPSPNVARFKAKFGAQLQDFLEYRFEHARLSAVEQRARAAAKRVLRASITATRR
jgi:hypothetical protein